MIFTQYLRNVGVPLGLSNVNTTLVKHLIWIARRFQYLSSIELHYVDFQNDANISSILLLHIVNTLPVKSINVILDQYKGNIYSVQRLRRAEQPFFCTIVWNDFSIKVWFTYNILIAVQHVIHSCLRRDNRKHPIEQTRKNKRKSATRNVKVSVIHVL